MNKHLLWAMLCWLSLLAVGAQAQNLDIKETFEALSTDHGYLNSTIDPATYQNGAAVEYFERKPFITVTGGTGYQGTTIGLSNRQGGYTWTGEGVRGTSATIVRPAGYVVLNPITNSQNYKNFVINVAFAAPRGGNPNTGAAFPRDRIRVQYSFNGGAWTTGAMLMGNNARGAGNSARLQLLTNLADSASVIAGNAMPGNGIILDPTYRDVTVTLPSTALGTNLRVRVVLDITAVEVAFDNIRVTGDADSAPKPVLSNIESTAASYTEGGSPAQITNTLTVGYSDNSTTSITGATVSIGGFVQGQDQLNFSNQFGVSLVGFNTSTGVLTLTGTTSQANYQAALRTVTYSNSNTSTATSGTRTITFQVATGSTLSTTATRNLTVVPVLNAPAGLNYTEDFTSDGENTRYFGNPFVNTAQQTGFFRATNSPATSGGSAIGSATFSGQSGGYWFGEGTFDSNNNPTAPTSTLQLAPVDTRSRSDIKFTIAIGAAGTWRSYFNAANPADGFELFYRINGGAPVKFGAFYGNGTSALQDSDLNSQTTPTGTALTTTLRDFTFSLPAATAGVANLDFLLVQTTRGTVEVAFDNIRITGVAAPTVTTGTATNVGTTTASISNNSLTGDGGASLSDYGVVYVAGTGTPTTSNTKVQAGTSSPPSFPALFSVNLSGLSPGTTYTAAAYATNSVGTSYGSNVTFTTPTTVTSIVRAGANPTNAATAQYTVTFATSVTGLSVGNFATAPGAGISGSSVSSVSGSGTTYTVTVNTGSGSGSLGLNMVNSTGVTPSVSNLPFTGELYTVDKDRPTVAISSSVGASGSTTTTTPIPFRVTFSENVSGFVAGDVSVTNGSITGGTVSGASPGTTYDFTVTPLTPGTATTVNVVANVAQDAAGNTNTAAPAAVSITYNQPNTTVTSVTRLSPSPTAMPTVSYQVVFANSVTGVTASNFTVTGPTGAGVATNGVSGSGNTYTVLVNTGTGNGTLTLNVQNSTGISPTVTNVPYTSGEQYTITKSFAAAPTLRIQAAGSASGNGDVTAFVDLVQVLQSGTSTAVAGAVQNGSFETNNVDPSSFKKTADGVVAAPWSFTGLSGISRNASAFGSTAADGDAVALIQSAGDNNASLSQSLAVPTGSYQVSFRTIQRNYTSLDQRLNVFVNNVFVGTIRPNNTPTYDTFTSASFNVTAPALTATISSSEGPSGGSTSTNPIPFAVSFSQSVGTTFTASDVTVTGGTLTSGSFSGTGSGPYTFTVTPSGNTTVAVSLAAGVAQDANNTANTATAAYSLTYPAPVVATAQSVTLNLNANGTATLNASSVNNGSSGGVGALTYTIQKIVYGYVLENNTLTLATPNGVNFTQIRFASYGTPNDNGNGNYTIGDCNASNSITTAQNSYVGRSIGSMDANNGNTANNNPTLGDPCSGTPKALAVQAAYSANAASLTYNCTEANKTQYVLLTATDANGNSSTSVAQVTVNAPPTATLTNATPNPAAAGATVTVSGTNLSGATGLTVNGAAATITNLTSTGFTFVVPNGAAANGNIVVTLPCSQTLTRAFTVIPPATYTSSTADQPNVGRVAAGSTNQEILRVAVVISGATNPLSAQSFSFTTNGSTNPADITAARVYYTGTSGTLSTATQFGSAVSNPNGSFSVTGSQQLTTGTNYFFLVYDVAANATSGNVLDATVPSLTISGTAYTPSVTAPTGNRRIVNTSRVAGTALSLPVGSTSAYVDFAGNGVLLNGSYTQEAWIKLNLTTSSTEYYVLGNGLRDVNSSAPFISITGNGRLQAGFGGGTSSVFMRTSPNTLVDDEWNHVVATYDATTDLLILYLNGEEVQRTTFATSPNTSSRVNFVGAPASAGPTFFPGEIDEVSQWSQALSLTEIRQRRHLVRTGLESGLVSYLQFNDSGTTTTDAISSAVGTLQGSATRVTSTAPVGFGTSNLQTVAANTTYAFPTTNVSIAFAGVTGSSETVVFRLDGQPLGVQPTATGLQRTFTPAYWIIDKYSGGSFTTANVTYTLSSTDISVADQNTPSNLKLFKRGSNSDLAFDAPISATAANAAAGTVTFPVTSFSQTVIGTFGTSPLPVTLLSFTAERTGNDALLRWTTAQEKNNAYFEVEASADGREFRSIGRVTGNGNSTSRLDYQLKDANLLRYGASTVYYRLRQIDYDGTAQLSDVVALAVTGSVNVSAEAFPNPATDQLTVRLLGAEAAQAQAWLYDAQGRLVQQFGPAARAGADLHTSVQHLPNGVYTLRVQLPGRVLHRSVVISH